MARCLSREPHLVRLVFLHLPVYKPESTHTRLPPPGPSSGFDPVPELAVWTSTSVIDCPGSWRRCLSSFYTQGPIWAFPSRHIASRHAGFVTNGFLFRVDIFPHCEQRRAKPSLPIYKTRECSEGAEIRFDPVISRLPLGVPSPWSGPSWVPTARQPRRTGSTRGHLR